MKDIYYTNLLIDEVVNLAYSNRSTLAKIAFITLSELFGIKNLELSNKYEIILKAQIKKIQEKIDFISNEASNSLDQYLSFKLSYIIRLIINSSADQLSFAVLKLHEKSNSPIIVNILIKFFYKVILVL